MRPASPRGFAALISAILMSAILTALVFGESTSAFWSRYDQLDMESHLSSRALADSCAYEALLQYQENPTVISSLSYPETISFTPKTSCSIDSISTSNTDVSIYTSARFNTIYVKILVTALISTPSNTLTITSWKDVTSMPS